MEHRPQCLIIAGGIRSKASRKIGPSNHWRHREHCFHYHQPQCLIIAGGIWSTATKKTGPSLIIIISLAGGVWSTATKTTGPSNVHLIHQSHWRYREHCFHQHQPQCLIIIHKTRWRYREHCFHQHRPQPFHNYISHSIFTYAHRS